MVTGLEPTIWLATLGLVTGWWLGHRRIPGWAGFLCAAAAGLIADLIWGVYVLSPWPLVPQLARWSTWLANHDTLQAIWLAPIAPAPPVTYFAEQWASLASFGQRVGWWAGGLVGSAGFSDNLVLVGLAGLIAWSVAAWAGWWIARNGKPFAALLPTGILLAQQVYYSEASYWSLLVFLGGWALLMVMARLSRTIRTWESSGTDYSPEIRLDTALVGLAIAGLTTLLAPTLPAITSGEVSRAFWEIFRDPYDKMEQRLEGSFQGVQGARSLVPASGVAAGGLPRAHLLGGSPALGQEIALRITTRGTQPGEPLYWRGQTFAQYNGRGWSDDEEAISRQDMAAGEPWNSDPVAASRRSVLATVEVVKATRAVLYGPGEPISVDRPYQVAERAPGDLVEINVRDQPRRYTVLGGVLDQDPNLLRSAGTDYPSDPRFTELYLRYPEDLPPELGEYANRITEGTDTPYDRAVAIEAALREIPYSLDVPAPPPDREVVSWFLNDLRKGYCDYFATAMVVLARLNGIPARLAIGYAAGDYDERTRRYTVTELQAHSWPELYFPGYGWVAFEPTPARALPSRLALADVAPPWGRYGPQGLESSLGELRQLAATESASSTRHAVGQWAVLGICLALALQFIVAWRKLQAPGTPEGVAAWYQALTRWGARLGRPLHPADTPREYARALGGAAAVVVERSGGDSERLTHAATTVGRQSDRLARVYELGLYDTEDLPGSTAPKSTGSSTGRRPPARRGSPRPWASLWTALRRLWLASRRARFRGWRT